MGGGEGGCFEKQVHVILAPSPDPVFFPLKAYGNWGLIWNLPPSPAQLWGQSACAQAVPELSAPLRHRGSWLPG